MAASSHKKLHFFTCPTDDRALLLPLRRRQSLPSQSVCLSSAAMSAGCLSCPNLWLFPSLSIFSSSSSSSSLLFICEPRAPPKCRDPIHHSRNERRDQSEWERKKRTRRIPTLQRVLLSTGCVSQARRMMVPLTQFFRRPNDAALFSSRPNPVSGAPPANPANSAQFSPLSSRHSNI